MRSNLQVFKVPQQSIYTIFFTIKKIIVFSEESANFYFISYDKLLVLLRMKKEIFDF